jgi:hydroxymethylbilane synthase
MLRLGTRGSQLARMQSQMIADALEDAVPGLKVELVIIKTTGDQVQDRPLHDIGGKGLFTKELEQALLAGEIDFAVHSFKDVPVTLPLVDTSDLVIAAVPKREDPRDVLVATTARTIQDLPPGARVGTGSLRRQSQLLALRPDLVVEMIRGNVDTRLRKRREGQYDAVILAMAGVKRAGLYDEMEMAVLPVDQCVPAAAQGALALECRRSDAPTHDALAKLNDPATADCVQLERQVVLGLNGDCHSPIAALATLNGTQVTLRTAVGGRDGKPPVIRAEATGESALCVLADVLHQLKAQDVYTLLGTSEPVHPQD